MPTDHAASQPPSPEDLRRDVADLIRAVYRHAGALAAEMAGQVPEVHPTDHNAIRLLDHAASRPVTVGELGRDLHLSSASVTEMVDRLERAGFVTRQRDPDDRRRVLVVLTGRSRDMAMDVLRPLLDRLDAALARRDEAQLADIAAFLREVLAVDPAREPD